MLLNPVIVATLFTFFEVVDLSKSLIWVFLIDESEIALLVDY